MVNKDLHLKGKLLSNLFNLDWQIKTQGILLRPSVDLSSTPHNVNVWEHEAQTFIYSVKTESYVFFVCFVFMVNFRWKKHFSRFH